MSVQPQAYKFQAPTGIPGDIDRVDESSVEPVKFASDAVTPTEFGFPLIFNNGAPEKWGSGNAAADFQGILVREVPQIGATVASDADFNSGVPWSEQVMGMLVRGYMAVKVAAGTPKRGGTVYVQSTAHSGVNPGAFRADGTDSGNAVALTATQAEWATDGLGPDGQGNTNIGIIRVAR